MAEVVQQMRLELGVSDDGSIRSSCSRLSLDKRIWRRTWLFLSDEDMATSASDPVREQEIERAAEIFEEISGLLDRRLYRSRQLYWRLTDKAQGTPRQDTDQKMQDYRELLYEWNDNVHRNLALLHRYFGEDMRNRLDYTIGKEFIEIGAALEGLWTDARISEKEHVISALDHRLTKLSDLVYELNIDMIRMLQSGSVGLNNPAI